MIRVVTPSRLHFGLIAPMPGSLEQATARVFGGAGLMIEKPGLVLEMTEAPDWSCEGPLADRATREWQRMLRRAVWLLKGSPRHRLRITHAAREHVGLGTGTQLVLAIASALLEATPHRGVELWRLAGRGARSAIGYHGFFQGGFLIDGGKPIEAQAAGVAPLVARHAFPEAWRIVLVIPRATQGCHGNQERLAFNQLAPPACESKHAQCSRLLLEILPALAEAHFRAFSEGLHQYNRQAGEPFRAVQGGPYCSPEAERLIEQIRDLGLPGAGQSSWGPTVFACAEDEVQAEWLARRLRDAGRLDHHEIVVTRASNQGASVTVV